MTVVARIVRATPYRSADAAWEVIVDLLAPVPGEAREELQKVTGIASSLIAAEAPRQDRIVVWGGGTRVRISCLYDEDAVTGDNANEAKLVGSATEGDWSMSLPCPEEELSWVTAALATKSERISARILGEKLTADTEHVSSTSSTIDPEAFLRP